MVDMCTKAEYLGIIFNTENNYNAIEEGIVLASTHAKDKLFYQRLNAFCGPLSDYTEPMIKSSFEYFLNHCKLIYEQVAQEPVPTINQGQFVDEPFDGSKLWNC